MPGFQSVDQQAQLLAEFEQFARSGVTADALMQRISDRVHGLLTRYNWVGFYLIDKADPQTLVLGPRPLLRLRQGRLCSTS